jgi:glyoxylase-like metal-dependent hydrolase (beta-lactamase superfamily II)
VTEGIRFPFDAPVEGQVTEVADGILWLRLPLPMALDHVNIYALDDGDGWTIVDTGFHSRRGEALWQTLLDGPLSAKPVTRVVATHHHPDHIGMAGWFQARGAELLTTRTAWLYTRMLCLDVQDTYSPESIAFYRAAGMPDDMLSKRITERPFNFSDCVVPLPLGYTRLQDGQTIRMAQRDWTAMHPNRPRSGPMTSSLALTSCCPAFPPISACSPPNPTPTP